MVCRYSGLDHKVLHDRVVCQSSNFMDSGTLQSDCSHDLSDDRAYSASNSSQNADVVGDRLQSDDCFSGLARDTNNCCEQPCTIHQHLELQVLLSIGGWRFNEDLGH
jgi:hypothetical protein